MDASELLAQLLNVAVTCDGKNPFVETPTYIITPFQYSQLSIVGSCPTSWTSNSLFFPIAQPLPLADIALDKNQAPQTPCIVRVVE